MRPHTCHAADGSLLCLGCRDGTPLAPVPSIASNTISTPLPTMTRSEFRTEPDRAMALAQSRGRVWLVDDVTRNAYAFLSVLGKDVG